MRKSGNSRRWPLRGMPQQEGRRRPARRDRALAAAWRSKNIRFNLLCPLPPTSPLQKELFPCQKLKSADANRTYVSTPLRSAQSPRFLLTDFVMSVTIRPSQLQNNALIRRVVNASLNPFFCPPSQGAAWRNRSVCCFVY